MSWLRPVLNRWLRLTEKRYLARETDPAALRARFERRVRLLFPPPSGVPMRDGVLTGGGGEIPALWIGEAAGRGTAAGPARPVVLYLHGGGYVFGSPHTHAPMLARLAQLSGVCACLPDYRLAPEHPFPAALVDARAAYRGLLAQGVPPDRIVLGGDSAGGGLALALLSDLCLAGLPRPAGLFALSPLTDLTFSGDSFRRNARADALLPATRGRDLVEMYLAGADPTQPGASPLRARFDAAPPVLLFAGDTEILLDDARRMAEVLCGQGVETDLRIARDLPHVWPFFWRYLPEAAATMTEIAGWIRQRLSRSAES